MGKRPEVSVVIPIYNTGKYLADCLDSVVNQTLSDIEIICVDDGSTDDSLDILPQYAVRDSRICPISREKAGVSAARNMGLEHAKGGYVLFMDSDDMLAADALEQLVCMADKKQTDILCFDAAVFFENAELENKYQDWIDGTKRSREYGGVVTGAELFAEMDHNHDYRAPCTRMLYRRAYLIEKGLRFYEGIVHEDELFTLISMLEASAVFHVRKAYYQRRVREDSVMTSKIAYRNFQGYFVVYAELVRYALSHTFEDHIQKQLWDRILVIRKSAFERYDQLPRAEKKGITWTDDPYVKALFRMNGHEALRKKTNELKSAEKKLAEIELAEKELAYIKRDPLIRLWLKIKGGLKCLRENGAAYTCRRICQKVNRRIARR